MQDYSKQPHTIGRPVKPYKAPRDKMVTEINEAVTAVLEHPRYSSLVFGTITKAEVLADVERLLDEKIAKGKEKRVDQLLKAVKVKLMQADEFTYAPNWEEQTFKFTYNSATDNKGCDLFNNNKACDLF